jgi:predicted transcriptional regulator
VALNPLTGKQSRFWELRDRGLTLSQIARMLGITRQSVSKTLIRADVAVRDIMLEAAEAYKIDVYRVNEEKGILSGHSRALGSRIFMTFSPSEGLNVWYRDGKGCAGCEKEGRCRQVILDEAERLGIPSGDLAPPGVDPLDATPAHLADRLFEIILPGDETR